MDQFGLCRKYWVQSMGQVLFYTKDDNVRNYILEMLKDSANNVRRTTAFSSALWDLFEKPLDISGELAGQLLSNNFGGYIFDAFLTWLQVFAEPNYTWGPERSNLNRALIAAAQAEVPAIAHEFEDRRLNAKIEMLKALTEELGYKVVPKDADEDATEAALYRVEDSGQLKL
ncbi:hypothetical protein D2Q93_08695 [Alicyclobacillaceae bacterium I2511]|nr:hypothetical protein D2Q93_08695 [Alicyclobacillaceae bacterium I2511]